MRKLLLALTVLAMLVPSISGAVFAAKPTGLGSNPNHNAGNSANCIGVSAAQVTHNGLAVRNQARQAEIKFLQALCNGANQK